MRPTEDYLVHKGGRGLNRPLAASENSRTQFQVPNSALSNQCGPTGQGPEINEQKSKINLIAY